MTYFAHGVIAFAGSLFILASVIECRSTNFKQNKPGAWQDDEAELATTQTTEYDEKDVVDDGDWSEFDDVTTPAVVMLAAIKMPEDETQISKEGKKISPPIHNKQTEIVATNITDNKYKQVKNESSKKNPPTESIDTVTEYKPMMKATEKPIFAETENPSTMIPEYLDFTPTLKPKEQEKGKTVEPPTPEVEIPTAQTSTFEARRRPTYHTTTEDEAYNSKFGKPVPTTRPITSSRNWYSDEKPETTTEYEKIFKASTTDETTTSVNAKHIANIAWNIDDKSHQATYFTERNTPQQSSEVVTQLPKVNNKSKNEKKKENEVIKDDKKSFGSFQPLPTSSLSPSIFIRVELTMPWDEVCKLLNQFRSTIVLVFHESTLGIDVSSNQVHVISESLFCLKDREKREIRDPNIPRTRLLRTRRNTRTILLEFYMVRTTGQFTATLTKLCASIMDQAHDRLQQLFEGQYLGYSVMDIGDTVAVINKGMEPGSIIAMVLTPLAAFGLISVIVVQTYLIRRRQLGKPVPPFPGTGSTSHSVESVSLAAVLAGAYPLTYYNEGMEMEVTEPSRPTIFPGVNNYRLDSEALDAEFKHLPNYMPRLSEVPRGAESKNRYANVIPLPETRVHLESKLGEKNSEYINANYVKGFYNRAEYLATQAPLPSTIPDFWRMVWENQCRVVVMLDSPSELQQNKYTDYFPCDESGSMCLYGDFQILLKYREERTDYTLSTLELKNMERNLCREIHHFWYTGWPPQGVPDLPRNVVRFLIDLGPYRDPKLYEVPCVVHCSSGTGRTGTVIAIDIGMRSIMKDHCADIVNIVHHLRRQRAGAVQTREQYAFIHMALNEYTAMIRRTPVIRPNMSIGSSLDALDSSAC